MDNSPFKLSNSNTKNIKTKIELLLLEKSFCATCFGTKEDFTNWNTLFVFDDFKEKCMKEIISETFGTELLTCLSTNQFCEKCVNTILQAHSFVKNINLNHSMLHNYFSNLFKQINDGVDEESLLLIEENNPLNGIELPVRNKNNLKCPICDIPFTEITSYLKHYEKHKIEKSTNYMDSNTTSDNEIYKQVQLIMLNENPEKCSNEVFSMCKLCSGHKNLFISKSDLNTHISHIHKGYKIKIHKCNICPSHFKNRNMLKQHILRHYKKPKYRCDVCKEEFVHHLKFKEHMRMHNKNNLLCNTCGKYYSKPAMERHMVLHKKDKGGKCETCNKSFLNQYLLYKHKKIHNNTAQCPNCQVSVKKSTYKSHLRTHYVRKENKKCSKCDYITKYSECLEAHMNRCHLKVRPYQCDTCNKGFYAKLTLKEHVRTHNGEKPEQCEVCGNRFVNKKALVYHSRIHTGERPYPCDLCDEKFLSASRRQTHKIRKHFEPSIQCTVCLKMFFTRSTLKKHMLLHIDRNLDIKSLKKKD